MLQAKPIGRGLTGSILSLSLLTVMAGAAVAPALNVIQAHFAQSSQTFVQMIISIPALFIVITNFFFPKLCRRLNTRTLVLLGLSLYTAGGCAAGRSDSRDRNDAGRRCRKCVGNENRRFGSRERRKIRTQVTDESNPLIYLMSEKMKNLMVRTLSGAVLAVVVLGAVIWSQWSFGALLLAMLVAGMLEFYGLAEKQGNAPQKIVGMAAGIVLFALNFAFVSDDIEILGGASQAFACGMAFMLLLIPAMFICELYRKQQNPASGIGTTLMGVCYIALPLSLMCYIPIIGSEVWTPWVMIFYIFIIWANDVFAYLVGMSVGRHRMFERLSPKKSWEGFFGGLAGAVAMGYAAARVLDADVWAWLGLALVAAATGVLGDLVESMFKRAAGVKDSGNLIPGHGGVLDRFDALLLSAPFVFVYMLFVM